MSNAYTKPVALDEAIETVEARMMRLFSASRRAHATYNPDKATHTRSNDGKLKVDYKTVREPVTLDLWKQHLAGRYPLVLGLACDDGTSRVSVVDVDQYDIESVAVVSTVEGRKLPFYVRRSKSGGAHVYAFHDTPIPVTEANTVAKGMARILGLKKVEYFPKPQNPDPAKLPTPLNMPYFGGQGGFIRPGSKVDDQMRVEEFLRTLVRLTAEQRGQLLVGREQKTFGDGASYAAARLKTYALELASTPQGERNNRLTALAFHMGTMIARDWIERETVEHALRDAISTWTDQAKTADTLMRSLNDGSKKPHADLLGLYVSHRDHMARARKLRELKRPCLLHYRDDFMDFDKGAYSTIDDGVVNADIWNFLDRAVTARGPFQPNRASAGETLAALKAVAHLNPKLDAPCWLDGRDGPHPGDVISFPNGLLNLRDNQFYQSDPAFFTTAALSFEYVADAPQPENWKKFLSEIYHGDDAEVEIAALQETFGYLLTADVSQEKLFLFLGPKRSGKGTMLNMMRSLLAQSTVAGPTLKSLGTTFGLAPLIGKQLAIVDDLRIGSPKDTEVMVENLLKISGRGLFTIDRKFKSAWHGILPMKLVLVSNVMPKLGDDSAALASRFIISNTKVSYYGNENPNLFEEKLRPELLGVFHWALAGLRRLRERGRFEETEASKQAKERMEHLSSPVLGFVAEQCELHPDKSTPKNVLYMRWCEYAETNGLYKFGKEQFFAALYAAAGGKVHSGKPRKGDGGRLPSCFGIGLKQLRGNTTGVEGLI